MKRTLPGILLALSWVLLLVYGSALQFNLVMLAVALIGADEYLKMIFKEVSLFSRLYLYGAICLPIAFQMVAFREVSSEAGLFISIFLITVYCIYHYSHFENCFEILSRLVFGVVYIGLLGSYLVLLRDLPQGGSWLLVLSAITAGSDSGAYYFGSAFGRRKLCIHISPKKTVEGALGGLLCGLMMALLFSGLLFDSVNWLFVILSAILLTGVGILGDLTESIIKRGTGTKDSGHLLAGHGGILDRIDSLLLTAPVLYYLLIVVGVA